MLAKYIGPEILSYYGFNEGEPSIGPLFTENNRMYMLYIGYFNEKNMHILIARSKDTRGKEELFLETIPNMTDEESLGPRSKEFYNHLNLRDKTLQIEPLLADWEHFYNYKRPHASLNGKTPHERYLELETQVPTQGEVTGKYWEKSEVIRPRNYQYLTLIKKIGLSQMS